MGWGGGSFPLTIRYKNQCHRVEHTKCENPIPQNSPVLPDYITKTTKRLHHGQACVQNV